MNFLYDSLNALSRASAKLASHVGKTTPRLSRIIKWSLGIFLVVEFLAGCVTVFIDIMRKWSAPQINTRPALPLKELTIAGNRLNVHTHGTSLYSKMLNQIRSAQSHIFFETFIWKSDEVGKLFKEELCAAARRGVEVFIIYDVFANLIVNPAFKRFPNIDHLHVLPFGVIRSFPPTLRSSGRDHRKILTIDGKVGFVGGYNIGAVYATQWRDTHLELTGTAVAELDNAFIAFWNDHRKRRLPILSNKGIPVWQPRLQAHRNTPNRLLFPVRGLYISSLERANVRAWITQAYFIPDREILGVLIAAARRGVDVKVLMARNSNHIAADWVARSYYADLLEAGVEIWLYENAMVHAKTMTVDGRWSTIGTANVDRLSMTGNYEINMEIQSTVFARHLERIFNADLDNASRLTLAQWSERPLLNRMLERILRPLGAIL